MCAMSCVACSILSDPRPRMVLAESAYGTHQLLQTSLSSPIHVEKLYTHSLAPS